MSTYESILENRNVLEAADVYDNVDYEFHKQGEDLGWCKNAREKNYKLYSASYIYAPHIMSKDIYYNYLNNGDNRGNVKFDKVS